MKNISICFILLLLFGFSQAFAQVTRSEATADEGSASLLADPKISPEEQALMLLAGEDNPAKIDESTMTDPKMNPEEMATEEDFGPSNAKPAEELNADQKLENQQSEKEQVKTEIPIVTSNTEGVQPEGDKTGVITDFRTISGGDNTQPPGEQQGTITDFSKIQGSNEQPAGDTPGK